MRFVLKNNSNDNIFNLMRRAGYHFWGSKENHNKNLTEMNFIRPVAGGTFPRFHIYLRENPDNQEIIFNLHLDQRRTIYQGAAAHKGEYDGELLEKEKKRIERFFVYS